MNVARTIAELRAQVQQARSSGARVGFVATMGAFHAGHVSLMRRAREDCGFVVVSLFVNPAQFNEPADLEKYPRDEAGDTRIAEDAGVHLLFAPAASEVYPPGFSTSVEVGGLSEPLEGEVRGRRHFRGVATVVAKLFNMVQPDVAYFGQKDAQQALLIRRLVRDLDLPLQVEVCPTVREEDGLAMSSRNVLLDAGSRARAPALYRALSAVEQAVADGERKVTPALARGRAVLAEAGLKPEYLAAVSTDSLAPVERFVGETLVAIAVRFGAVRLIDNVIVPAQEPPA